MSEYKTVLPAEALMVNATPIPDSAFLPQKEQQKPEEIQAKPVRPQESERVAVILSEPSKLESYTTVVDRYHFGPQAGEARGYDLTQEGKKQLVEYSETLKDADLKDIIQDYLYLSNKDENGKPNETKREETLVQKTMRQRMAKVAEARMRYRVQDIVSAVPNELIQDIIGERYYADGESAPNVATAYLSLAQRLTDAKIDLPKKENRTMEKAPQDPRFAELHNRIVKLSIEKAAAADAVRKEAEAEVSQDYLMVAQHLADVKADMKSNPNPPTTVEAAAKRAGRVDKIVQYFARHGKKLTQFVQVASFVIGNLTIPHPEVQTVRHNVVVVNNHVEHMNQNSQGEWKTVVPLPDNPKKHQLTEAEQIRLDNLAMHGHTTARTEAPTVPSQPEMEEMVIPGEFGNIKLGGEGNTTGDPVVFSIRMGNRIIKGAIFPKHMQDGEQHQDPFDYRKKYNTNYADGDGSMLQTLHSGESPDGSEQWPGEEIRKFVEEEGNSPEEQLAKIANADEVTFVQGKVDPKFMPKDFSDPVQVQKMIDHVGPHGEGMINPVVQEAQVDLAGRLDPQTTTAYDTDLKTAPADTPASVTKRLGIKKNRLGRLTTFECGKALKGEMPDPSRHDSSQSRIVLGFVAVQPKQ